MTKTVQADFRVDAFRDVAGCEVATAALIQSALKIGRNVSSAVWGLAIARAVLSPEVSPKAIMAGLKLSLDVDTSRDGDATLTGVFSRAGSALSFLRSDRSSVQLPKVTGADDEKTALQKAQAFIVAYPLTATYAASRAVPDANRVQRATQAAKDTAKAEKAALSLAGVTAKVPFSLTAITETENMAMLIAACEAGDENALKVVEHVIRHLGASVVRGETARDARKPKAKRAPRKAPALKVAA